jgi:SAM-dependent methyltransferase
MHQNNRSWLEDLKRAYPQAFLDSVLELGSRDFNGSARSAFSSSDLYVGVDCVEGSCVDIVCAAKDIPYENEFGVVVCLSMLEHDPEWRESLSGSIRALRNEGLLFLAFGAEGNPEHCEEAGIPFVRVLHADVLSHLRDCGYQILESFWEEDRYGLDVAGCYNVVARKQTNDT